MRKQFEEVKIEICFMEPQAIVTTSLYIEWDENWSKDDSDDYIFG